MAGRAAARAVRTRRRRRPGSQRGGGRGGGGGGRGPGGGAGRPRASRAVAVPVGARRRAEVIDELDRDGLLPAITFIFSRVGCEAAVGQLLAAGTRLIPEREGLRIRRHVEERVESLADEDLSVLGYFDFVEGLSRGFAAHHAGMLPLFREIVEELFTAAPHPGRVRDRDAGARHQHAGAHRRAREAREVQRRGARRHHPRRVHPAHRPRRPSRHRHRGPRRRAVGPRRRPARRRRASPRPAPTRCARASGRPTTWPSTSSPRSGARWRARSSRPRSPSSRPTGPSSASRRAVRRNEEGLEGYDRGDALPPRRLPRVRRAAPLARRRREGRGQGALGVPPGRGRGLARGAADRRRHPHPGRAPRRVGRRRAAGPHRQGRARPGRPSSPRTSSSAG